MSRPASSPFLRRVLWADAASCVASGAVQLLALDALVTWLRLPRAVLLESGVFLLAYGVCVAWVASRPVLPRGWIALFAIGNVAWAVGCGVLLGLTQPTVWGVAWVAAQAATVLVLAQLQWLGLRRGVAHGAMSPA